MNPRATHFRAYQVVKSPDSFASVKLLRIEVRRKFTRERIPEFANLSQFAVATLFR